MTDEEKKIFLKNEERLWDLAAITAAPTIYQLHISHIPLDGIAVISYNLANELMKERRKRLSQETFPLN